LLAVQSNLIHEKAQVGFPETRVCVRQSILEQLAEGVDFRGIDSDRREPGLILKLGDSR
jgi:hypothetical protein